MTKITLFFFIVPILIAALLSGCSNNSSSQTGKMVTFKSDSKLEVISYVDMQTIESGLGNSVSSYLCDNALLNINSFIYMYKSVDGKQLDIKTTKNFLFVNGKLRGINIDETNQVFLTYWISKSEKKDFSDLNSIQISATLDKDLYKLLLAIIENNPKIFISGDYKERYNRMLSSLSKPEFFVAADCDISVFDLVDFSDVSMIFISQKELTPGVTIEKFPSLKRLFFLEDGVKEIVDRFPHLEAVSFSEDELITDLSFLKKHRKLKEAYIIGNESLKDISGLKSLKKLEYVHITGCNLDNIDGLKNLKNLKALVVSGAGLQSLEILTRNNPGLSFLNIAGCELASITSIQNLKELEGLILGDNADELNLMPLKKLTRLRFLGLDEKFFTSEEYTPFLNEVKTICPSCIIYQFKGFCLGSGWLLAFVPLFLLFLYVKKRTTMLIINK